MLEWLKNNMHPMERPEAWGAFHLLFFAVGIPSAIVLAFLLRKLSKRAEKRLYFAVGIVLMLSEVFKQLAFTALEGAYRFDLIPFQLCSIPMYLCLLIGVLPESVFTRAAKTFIASFGLLGGIASYIAPGTMCRDWLELTLHSFLWHLCLIFLGYFVILSENTEIRKRSFGCAVIMYLSLCCIAFAINILCFNVPGADVNMFYIGPKPSILPICRDITAKFGVAVNSVIYMLSVSVSAGLVCLSGVYLKKVIQDQRISRLG